MAVSQNLINFVKEKENFTPSAHEDIKQISYGYGEKAPFQGATITEAEAEANLVSKLSQIQNNIASKYADRNWNQNQLDALTSFSYNLGEGSLDQLTANDTRTDAEIAEKMKEYVKSGKTVKKVTPGLVTRRNEESALFAASELESDAIYQRAGVTPVTGTVTNPPITSSTSGLTSAGTQTDQSAQPSTTTGTRTSNLPDDAKDSDTTATTTKIPDVFEVVVEPRPNRFKQFATMTYSISLYLLDPEEYKAMMANSVKSVAGLTLILQSGGITNAANDSSNFGAKRSEYFNYDFYIDDLQLEGMVSGTATTAANNVFKLNFKITEPAGLSFLERLYGIIYDHQKATAEKRGLSFDPGQVNYAAQNYLMVIRFYGYDAEGNQITSKQLDTADDFSDSQSVAEKFIPFMFTNITFELTSDSVNYLCSCMCPNSLSPLDYMHATVPHNMQFQGQTVKDILLGRDGESNDHIIGLAEKLNAHQEQLVKENKQSFADVFEIHFEEDQGIDTASVLTSGTTRMERTGFEDAQKTTDAMLNEHVKKGLRTYDVRSGMSITQFIDHVLRTSAFITDQYAQIKDENTDTVRMTNKKIKYLTWFKINTEVELLQYDKIRNDYAYKIKYVISRYKVNSLSSPYFTMDKKQVYGVHKEYNYWFSGLNTEVLKFNQKFDYLWYQSMNAYYNPDNLETNNLGTIQRRTHRTNPAESAYGGENASSNAAAEAARELYSPGDQAMVSIEIVGDPDFICQSELFYGPLQRLKSQYAFQPFLRDGSINYDASEVYFTINYNTVVDYNLTTGLADTVAQNIGRDISNGKPGVVKHQFLYRANTITSKFIGGAFTQILDGTMFTVPADCIIQMNEDERNARVETPTKTTEVSGRISNPSANTATKPQFDLTQSTYPSPGQSDESNLGDGSPALSETNAISDTTSPMVLDRPQAVETAPTIDASTPPRQDI